MSYQLLYAGWTCYWFSPSITISNYTRDSLKKSKSKSATTTEAVASALAPPKDVKDLRQIAGYGRVNIFTYSELRAATKNFRLDQILGEGGFGIVYEVGVKELNPDGFQGDKEWLAEVNSLGQLSHSILVFRDLSSNPDLVGSLLESISKLQKLTTLILQGWNFTGTIPTAIGNLRNLTFLALNSNNFSGSIPSTFGLLSNMYWLDLADNQLTRPLPMSSGTSPGLDYKAVYRQTRRTASSMHT